MPGLDAGTPKAVWFRRPSGLPLPALGGPGVAISVVPAVREDRTPTLRIVGVCACGSAELAAGRLPLEAVWIVAILAAHTPIPATFPVAGDALVFADDHEFGPGWIRGAFDLDLFAQANLAPTPGVYRVTATFGAYVSPVVEARLVG